MGEEAMEKVQDGNDKDLNIFWSNGGKQISERTESLLCKGGGVKCQGCSAFKMVEMPVVLWDKKHGSKLKRDGMIIDLTLRRPV